MLVVGGIATTTTVINAVGKAAAITRRDSSATLPPRARGKISASCVRAHAGIMLRTLDVFVFSDCSNWCKA